MAKQKLSLTQQEEITREVAKGKTLKELGVEYGVSASTISRCLSRQDVRVKHNPVSKNSLDDSTKLELRKVLLGFDVKNPNLLISELGKRFEIKIKEKEEYVIIYV